MSEECEDCLVGVMIYGDESEPLLASRALNVAKEKKRGDIRRAEHNQRKYTVGTVFEDSRLLCYAKEQTLMKALSSITCGFIFNYCPTCGHLISWESILAEPNTLTTI